jgi:hypothetical protein
MENLIALRVKELVEKQMRWTGSHTPVGEQQKPSIPIEPELRAPDGPPSQALGLPVGVTCPFIGQAKEDCLFSISSYQDVYFPTSGSIPQMRLEQSPAQTSNHDRATNQLSHAAKTMEEVTQPGLDSAVEPRTKISELDDFFFRPVPSFSI